MIGLTLTLTHGTGDDRKVQEGVGHSGAGALERCQEAVQGYERGMIWVQERGMIWVWAHRWGDMICSPGTQGYDMGTSMIWVQERLQGYERGMIWVQERLLTGHTEEHREPIEGYGTRLGLWFWR